MNPGELAWLAMSGDDLGAREWVKAARRARVDWSLLPAPEGVDEDAMAVAAALVELLALRDGAPAPRWTSRAGRAREPVYLLARARTSAALRRWCDEDTPAVLRARNVFAVRDYLKVL
jgi:hypothetical protein